jgi:Protein of unknown function (DUF2846)
MGYVRAAVWLCGALLALVLAGCASTPQAPADRDADAKRFDAHPDAATIYVYRSEFNRAPGESVLYMDGRLIGGTLPGSFYRIDVAPGRHTLHGVGIDAGMLALETRPGQLYFVSLTVIAGSSRFAPVSAEQGQNEVVACCAMLETWRPGQRPLLR